MQTFKEHYLTEAKKAVSREQAEEYLNTIKRQINPEMSDPVRQNGDWWDLMIRDHDFFLQIEVVKKMMTIQISQAINVSIKSSNQF